MNNWKQMTLREAGVQLIDCEHKTPTARAEGYPYIAIPQLKGGHIDITDARRISHEDHIKWTRKAKPRAWDVVLSRRCNPGETAVVPEGLECSLGQNLVLLRSDGKKVFAPFLRWLTRGPEWWEQIQRFLNVGAVFDSLKCADVPNFRLSIPPFSEQRAIACILGTLDDKIELNRRRCKTLEAMARAIFQSWFVDFDPVRAKAAVRKEHPRWTDKQVSRAACPKLKPELAALFPDRFEDSPLGPIPAGWRVGTVGDIAELNGWTLSKRDELDVIDYIEISEVMRGEVATITRYSRGSEPSRARRRLRHGDTALSTVRPDRGAYFLSIEPSPNLIASTGFAVLTPKAGHWAFVHVITTRRDFGDELGRLADGGAYPAVRPEVIADRPAIIPPDQVVVAFEKIAQPMFLSAEKARQESRTLAALRDALLPKLISGELRVPDAERIVGRVT